MNFLNFFFNRKQEKLSDEEVRWLNTAYLSKACYEEDAFDWLNEKLKSHDKYHHYITEMSQTVDDEGMSYIIARKGKCDEENRTIYVAIRGSENYEDLKSCLTTVDGNLFSASPGQVHKGFLDRVKKLPLSMLLKELDCGTEVTFTGHSLGGAVAALGASKLLSIVKQEHLGKINCITFGAPLYCDEEYSNYIYGKECGNKEAFVHYINPEDKIPLLLSSLDWVKGTNELLNVVTPDYHPSGTFKFLPAVKEVSAEEHVKQGMKKEDLPPTIGKLVEMGKVAYKNHMMDGYFDNTVNSLKARAPYPESTTGIQFKPLFVSDHEKKLKIIEMMYSPILSTKVVDGNHVIEIRLILKGPLVWATRTIESQDLEIISTEGQRVTADVKNVFVTEKSRQWNEVQYRISFVDTKISKISSWKVKLNASLIFRSADGRPKVTQEIESKVDKSYYFPTNFRLRNVGIHDILVFIRSRIYALHNLDKKEQNFPENLIEKRSQEDLAKLDKWMYDIVRKLNKRQMGLLEEALGALAPDFRGNNDFVKKLIEKMEGSMVSEKGSKRTEVTKTEFSDFVKYNDKSGVVAGPLNSARIELLLCVVLHYVFQSKVCVSFAIWRTACIKKYGRITEVMNILMVILSLGTIHLFSWYSIDYNLRGSTEEHINLLKIFKSGKDVDNLMTYEEHVIKACDSDKGWDDIVNGEYQGIWKPDTKAQIIKFMTDFLGPIIELRKLLLETRVFHIAVVGQIDAGKSSLCTSGIFQNLNSEKYKAETTQAKMYSISPTFAVTDYPGMMGNDGNTHNDAKVDALKQTIESIDFVIVLIKYGQRDCNFIELLEAIKGKQAYVCLTHVDDWIKKNYRNDAAPARGVAGEHALKSIQGGIDRYVGNLRNRFIDVKDIHCFLPLGDAINNSLKTDLISFLSKCDDGTRKTVPEEYATNVLNNIFSHDYSSLTETIAEVAKSEGFREDEINYVFNYKKKNDNV